jgi:putative membrane protein
MRRGVLATALLALAIGLLLSRSTLAQSERKAQPLTDEHFVKMASADNLAEIDLAKLAVKQTTNPDVRRFAERMIKDHSKLNKELSHMATTKAIPVATKMNKEDRQLVKTLSALHGAAFDRDYMKHMIDGHKEAISLFERETKSGLNPAVKEFASKSLPTLREHLELARKTNSEIK